MFNLQTSRSRQDDRSRSDEPSDDGQFCPVCDHALTVNDVNIVEGVALCPSCHKLSPLSEVITHKKPAQALLDSTPGGCQVHEFGDRIVVHASLRSMSGFVGGLAVSLFWNGIVSVFVLIAIGGLYINLVGPLPHWLPAPSGSQMGLGMTLFLCIFLIPFVLVGSGMIGYTLLSVFGKVDVVIEPHHAQVRTGIGFLVWPKPFNPNEVTRVALDRKRDSESGSVTESILIQADRKIIFGSMLPEHRREWMRAMLRQLLMIKPQSTALSARAQSKRIID